MGTTSAFGGAEVAERNGRHRQRQGGDADAEADCAVLQAGPHRGSANLSLWNLRRERMAREVTQERLAKLVDPNVRTVQKIEAGQTNILLTTVLRFQRALKCPRDALMPKR